RPTRPVDRVRDPQPAGARRTLRRARGGALRRHDRRRERARRGHGRERHEGEEAHQHAGGLLRRDRPPDPAAPALARAGARVHPRRRVRRGDAEVDPPAQGRAERDQAPERRLAPQARGRLGLLTVTPCQRSVARPGHLRRLRTGARGKHDSSFTFRSKEGSVARRLVSVLAGVALSWSLAVPAQAASPAARFAATVGAILAQPYQPDYVPLGVDSAFGAQDVPNAAPAQDYTTGSIPGSPDAPQWPAAFHQVVLHSADGAPLIGELALQPGTHPGI